MSEPNDKFAAKSWRGISPWMIPSLLIPAVLALVLVGYVVLEAAN